MVVFGVGGFEILEPELEDVGALRWLLVLSLRPLVTAHSFSWTFQIGQPELPWQKQETLLAGLLHGQGPLPHSSNRLAPLPVSLPHSLNNKNEYYHRSVRQSVCGSALHNNDAAMPDRSLRKYRVLTLSSIVNNGLLTDGARYCVSLCVLALSFSRRHHVVNVLFS